MGQKPTYEELEKRVRDLEKKLHSSEASEKTLFRSREHYRMLFENGPLPYQSLDAKGNLLAVNSTWLSILGYSEEEVIGRNFSDFLHPDWKEHFRENFARFKAVGEVLGTEFTMVKKDGTEIMVSFQGRIGQDSFGQFARTHCVFKDISEIRQAEEVAAMGMAHYRTIFEYAPYGILVADDQSYYLDVNPCLCEMFGYTRKEFIGLHASDIVAEEEVPNIQPALSEIHHYAKHNRIWRFKRKDGSFFNAEVSVAVLPGEKLLATIRDLTEREKTERALEVSRKRLLDAQRLAKLGDFQWNVKTGEVSWSDALYDLLKYDRSEKINFDLISRIISHPEELERVTTWLNGSVESGQSPLEPIEYRVVRKDGKTIHVRTTGILRHDEKRNPVVFATVQDISDKRAADKERELLFKAIEYSINGFDIVSQEGKFIYINKAYARMWGYENGAEVIDSSPVDHCSDPTVPERIIGQLKQKGNYELEFQAKRKDGTTFDVLMSAMLMHDDMGNELYAGSSVDISERNRAEKERQRLQNELLQAQKMESIGKLAGGVAHDFNNMLSIIMGYAELALENLERNDPLFDDITEIFQAGRRSMEITRQLLAFARQQTIEPKLLDLNDNISNMLKMFRRLLGEDIDIVWLPDVNIRQVKMDPSQLDQILANLCVNARDAMEGVGRLTIETGSKVFDEEYCAHHVGFIPGEFIVLAVSDSGHGIPSDIIDRVFEPFFTTKSQPHGTGLGLSTVYGIVKQNQGFVNVYSEMGRGSTFKIYLPVAEGVMSHEHHEDIRVLPLSRGETVLVVEDDATVLKLGERMLKALGYNVLTANTPKLAIDLVKAHGNLIDLLLTDVVMPQMNGRELSERLREICPDLKILYMSGYTQNVIADRGVLEEGVHFVQKPLSKRELARKIRSTLDHPM